MPGLNTIFDYIQINVGRPIVTSACGLNLNNENLLTVYTYTICAVIKHTCNINNYFIHFFGTCTFSSSLKKLGLWVLNWGL